MTKKERKEFEKSVCRSMGIIGAAIEKIDSDPKAQDKFGDSSRTRQQLEEMSALRRYTEPGYDDTKIAGIVFGNWNVPHEWNTERNKEDEKRNLISRVARALEHLGYELEWLDEWLECSGCNGAVRTSGNCWGWQPYSYCNHGEYYCGDCVKKDPSDYLAWLEGNEKRASTFELPLEKLGYVQVVDRLEHGMHHGQDADPKVCAKHMRSVGIKRFLFAIDNVGQFDMGFSIWVHEDEKDLIPSLNFNNSVNVDGPSVSQAMQRGLQHASAVAAKLPDVPGSVKYTAVMPDGSAAGTVIQGREFVEKGATEALKRIEAGGPGVIVEPDVKTRSETKKFDERD